MFFKYVGQQDSSCRFGKNRKTIIGRHIQNREFIELQRIGIDNCRQIAPPEWYWICLSGHPCSVASLRSVIVALISSVSFHNKTLTCYILLFFIWPVLIKSICSNVMIPSCYLNEVVNLLPLGRRGTPRSNIISKREVIPCFFPK